MPEHPSSISIVYLEAEGRPTITATGAYGGPSPDGSAVVAHLYTEFATVPSVEQHQVGEGGKIDLEKGEKVRRGDITRDVQATLVLPPEAAARLGAFLQEKARLAIEGRNRTQRQ